MNDKEMLQLAAKAAGVEIVFMGEQCFLAGLHGNQSFRFHQPWNPLTDDGDALRLAVALCIEVRNFNGNSHAGKQDQFWCTEGWFPDGDPCAATRRAIVRAAAERQRLK